MKTPAVMRIHACPDCGADATDYGCPVCAYRLAAEFWDNVMGLPGHIDEIGRQKVPPAEPLSPPRRRRRGKR